MSNRDRFPADFNATCQAKASEALERCKEFSASGDKLAAAGAASDHCALFFLTSLASDSMAKRVADMDRQATYLDSLND